MRRRLIVLRHAKSAWDSEAATDHERPLNKRGRRDAMRVAEKIAKLGWLPEHVISSDAERTRETWKRMRRRLEKKALDVVFAPELYMGGLEQMRPLVASVGERIKTVMVIGHNPGWEEAVSALVGKEVGMTTCNAAMISVEAKTWEEAFEKRWKLEHLLRPKDL